MSKSKKQTGNSPSKSAALPRRNKTGKRPHSNKRIIQNWAATLGTGRKRVAETPITVPRTNARKRTLTETPSKSPKSKGLNTVKSSKSRVGIKSQDIKK